MSSKRVHVIVVAFHAARQLERCLAALRHQVPVTVVDNSSSSDVARVAACYGAEYLDSGRNLGFAAAVNVALGRIARDGVDVLLLNPDAAIGPDEVRELERFLGLPANARVAAVAPRLRGSNEIEQRLSWPFPTPARMCAEAIGLGRLPSRKTFVVGAVLLLRSEAIADVGPFDERFFLYAEEADWQRRAHQRGWSSVICSSVVAHHAGAGTSVGASRRETLFHAAQETYIRKWYGGSGWWLYRLAACSGAAARAVLLPRERRRAAARRLFLYLRGPRRRAALGPH